MTVIHLIDWLTQIEYTPLLRQLFALCSSSEDVSKSLDYVHKTPASCLLQQFPLQEHVSGFSLAVYAPGSPLKVVGGLTNPRRSRLLLDLSRAMKRNVQKKIPGSKWCDLICSSFTDRKYPKNAKKKTHKKSHKMVKNQNFKKPLKKCLDIDLKITFSKHYVPMPKTMYMRWKNR